MNTKNNENKRSKSDLIYGNFELDDDEFSPQNVKVRITTLVDEDALEELKKIAEKRGIKYQTLLNQVIRSFIGGVTSKSRKNRRKSLSEDNVRQIVRDELRKRA